MDNALLERLLLVLAALALCAGGYALLPSVRRARRPLHSVVHLPEAAALSARVLLHWIPGRFVGTTRSADWPHGLDGPPLADRATGEICVATDGVHVVRDGLPELLLPLGSIRDVAAPRSPAGTGALVITWQLGDLEVCSGFRADDPGAHKTLRDAITASLPLTSPSELPVESP